MKSLHPIVFVLLIVLCERAEGSNFCARLLHLFRQSDLVASDPPSWLRDKFQELLGKGVPFEQKGFYEFLETRDIPDIEELLKHWYKLIDYKQQVRFF